MTNLKDFTFNDQIKKYFEIIEEEPMTVASTGLPTSGDDAFVGKTDSNLEGATTGYHYKKKKKKDRKKIKRSFLDYITEEDNEKKSDDGTESLKIDIEDLKQIFGEPIYGFGKTPYLVKFYRKNKNYMYGKMFFVGNNNFAMRFNKKKGSKNEVDSISFWNKWSTELVNDDLNFSITPDADVITEGLALEKCFEIAKQIFKNRKPRLVKLENITIEKGGKKANKQFEAQLKEEGKTSISFTELLDFALNNGYNVKEPGDGSLDINLIVPMKIPNKEYLLPNETEYKKAMNVDKFVDNNKLLLTPVNIQNFVSNIQQAEEILEVFKSLFKDNLINNLSFEAILFASKVRQSNHPYWLKLLIPKM